jgi:hypothetical protein
VNIAPTNDTSPPFASINYTANPQYNEPVTFTVTFNENVTGFTSSDIVLSGTANPTTAVVTAVNGKVYNVDVTGMNKAGTVAISIPAGAANDMAGNASLASSGPNNQVSFGPIAQIESVQFDAGVLFQRSMIRFVTLTFSSHVNLSSGAVTITKTGPGGGDVPLSVNAMDVGSKTVAKITYNGVFTEFTSLADGRYNLAINAGLTSDKYGQQIDGDHNGSEGGNYALNFHRLFGDYNGDATVDQLDYLQFRIHIAGGPNVEFDYQNSGEVDQLDYLAFRSRIAMVV